MDPGTYRENKKGMREGLKDHFPVLESTMGIALGGLVVVVAVVCR